MRMEGAGMWTERVKRCGGERNGWGMGGWVELREG